MNCPICGLPIREGEAGYYQHSLRSVCVARLRQENERLRKLLAYAVCNCEAGDEPDPEKHGEFCPFRYKGRAGEVTG